MTQHINGLPQEEFIKPIIVDESSTGLKASVWRRFRKHPGAVIGFIIFTLLIVMAILAPLSPYDPEASEMSVRNEAPSLSHVMGTDSLGRDLFTRILFGGRISLTVGLIVVSISLVV